MFHKFLINVVKKKENMERRKRTKNYEMEITLLYNLPFSQDKKKKSLSLTQMPGKLN